MANQQMDYSSDWSLLGKSALQSLTLTGDRGEADADHQSEKLSDSLLILAFCVLTLVATISWAMILMALLDRGQDGDPDTNGNGDYEDNLPLPGPGKDHSKPEAVSVEIVTVLRSTPPLPAPPSSKTRLTSMSTATAYTMPTTDTPASMTSITIRSPTTAEPRPLNQVLFCTYGVLTTRATQFPTDGLCDYIFYDSMYRHGYDKLTQNVGFTSALETVLAKAQSGGHRSKTQFGVGLAYGFINEILRDLANDAARVLLRPLVERGVLHFGVIDVRVYSFTPITTDVVFRVLQQLNVYVQDIRGQGLPSIIVYGSVSPTKRWNDYFKQGFKNTFKPDLFISHGYQLYQDWHRVPCIVTPPTLLTKPPKPTVNIHDLRDAMAALAALSVERDALSLSLSVTMKGRWSVLLPSSKPEIFSECDQRYPPPLPPRYSDICNAAPYADYLAYDQLGHAMRTYDPRIGSIFAFDNEQALCEKLCQVKANYTQALFGLAVYDLDYEDDRNTCSARNRFANFSRLKTVDRLREFFITQFDDPTKEAKCSEIWRL